MTEILAKDLSPQPSFPPEPPQLLQLKNMVEKEVEDKTRTFKDLPTPAAFATLENDVKHLWNYFKGLAAASLAIILAAWGVYASIDSKISALSEKVEVTSKDTENRYRSIERRILEDVKNVNNRVDNVIMENGIKK